MTGSKIPALTIIRYPDPRLRRACAPVETFNDDLKSLAGRMLELMKQADGIGLAAPQVGVLRRLFVCDVPGTTGGPIAFANPVLTDLQGEDAAEEGCLSIPEVTVTVKRATRCRIEALDLDGQPITLEGVDLAARCWQHECDHLDGRLIVDRMSEADRIANRRALKRLESRFR